MAWAGKRQHKYGAKKAQCAHGHTHDSQREARRCDELHLLERAGEIEGLEREPKFYFSIEGRQVKHSNGRRAVFTPDFAYWDRQSGQRIVEDSKGFRTKDYVLRAAFFRAFYPDLVLREV